MAVKRNPVRFRCIDEMEFERMPVRTHIISEKDDIVEVIDRYTRDVRRPGDVVAVSESVTAISQGRAIPEDEIRIGILARLLWRFVQKVPYGVGLRSPATMQCAINECGTGRILLAAIVSAFGKLVGRRGDFYRIAGIQAATIDAAHTSPVPPYDECVILGPENPDTVAESIRDRIGCEVAIMDVNDIGGSWVLGASEGIERKKVEAIMKDNPFGQADELTPIVIIRRHRSQ